MLLYVALNRVRLTPSHAIVLVGDTVIFTCLSNESVSWEYNGQKIPENAVETKRDTMKKMLVIKNVQIHNSGTYTCIGNDGGRKFEENGLLTVVSTGNMQNKMWLFQHWMPMPLQWCSGHHALLRLLN